MTDRNYYTYFYRAARGPGYGHQPGGFDPDTRDAWYPRQDVPGHAGGALPMSGKVEYPAPLTPEQVYKYELYPKDAVEWAISRMWDDLVRNDGYVSVYRSFEQAMIGARDEEIEVYCNESIVAVEIKALWDARLSLDDGLKIIGL